MVIVHPLLPVAFPSPPFVLFIGTALPFICVDSKAKVKGAFQGMSTLRDAVLSTNSEGALNAPMLAVQWRDGSLIWMKALHLDSVTSRNGDSPPLLPLSFASDVQ